jgi:hypothetical protein
LKRALKNNRTKNLNLKQLIEGLSSDLKAVISKDLDAFNANDLKLAPLHSCIKAFHTNGASSDWPTLEKTGSIMIQYEIPQTPLEFSYQVYREILFLSNLKESQ